MKIDTIRRRGPLSEEEKQQRRANRLCLYCGGPRHTVVICPHRPRRQVNQIIASSNYTKPESISVGISDCPNSANSPNLLNKFDVLVMSSSNTSLDSPLAPMLSSPRPLGQVDFLVLL